ncbi:MotA/TolQ/ExbB proton channel family protein [Exilibacterium tricleocarpae]|uniref:MotA/TolQ/ExbB proton channel family protein n=1 Tax=Exilibacterium tricleocarpae TaxID=2591008 RepID=A0A545SZ36_9GAMM|nr:MotA/TolQ/ExbB proton channel family protein [Exilibacterium tricleocarpae]TQV70189.1 MotA/TolQ/ExbB proton channel family protein [Exilibacterium tricleocarpae]
MTRIIEGFFPWAGTMIDLGGNILVAIVVIAAIIWCFIFERLYYLFYVHPARVDAARRLWLHDCERTHWLTQHWRQLLCARLYRNLMRNIALVKALIKLCPLLGLLGTVMGMLEVFDAVAITGSNNPRATASGVSKATVSTMAGMVVAISGLLVLSLVSRRIETEKGRFNDLFSISITTERKEATAS